MQNKMVDSFKKMQVIKEEPEMQNIFIKKFQTVTKWFANICLKGFIFNVVGKKFCKIGG